MKLRTSTRTLTAGSALVAAAMMLSAPAAAEETPVGSKITIGRKGLEMKSSGANLELRLGGRLQLDAAFHDGGDAALSDGTTLRRARVYLKGKVFERWDFKSQVELRDGEAEIKDLYLRYPGAHGTGFTAGNFKEPFSLENLTSSKDITFLERALPVAAFSPSRALGLSVHRGGEHGSAAIGIFGEPISGHNLREGQGYGIASRLTWAPTSRRRRVVHLGIAGEYRQPRRGEEIRFDAKPESSVNSDELVRTRRLEDIDNVTRYGFETAMVAGPVSVQGEYILADVQRAVGQPDVQLSGWYAYLSWFPTGESRSYEAADGTFGRVKPKRKSGAWELALRFSTLDLDDADVAGGQMENATLGLSWYANANLRFLANYVQVDSERRGKRDDPGILLLRAQIAF